MSTRIADIYELSPMQKAMLFHALHTPGSTTSFNQLSCRISGDLDIELFRESWHRLIQRQPVFRTAFQWEKLDKPVQLVYESVELPWSFCDWRSLSPEVQEERWREHLACDIAGGFEFDKAPLLRCWLARMAEREFLFSWSHHHLLTDGWCLSLVIEEILATYGHLHSGLPLRLAPVRPYRLYIEWLQHQDPERAKQYWTRYLDGFHAATPVPTAAGRNHRWGGAVAEHTEELGETLGGRLRKFASQHQISLSTVFNGAWALVLSRYSGETDVVFGTTVSGRPTELPGIEHMLGLFINTLPVRIIVDPRQALVPWLKMIQARQAARSQFEHTPLSDIQRWSGIPPGSPLFESNVVFMNYPLNRALTRGAHGLEISGIEIYDRADVPVALQATPEARWMLDLDFDPARFESRTMRGMLGHVAALLENLTSEPVRTLGRLSIVTPDERRQLVEDWNATDVEFDPSRTIVDRLEELAEKDPDRVVIECGTRTLTFGELNAHANRLARWMLAQTDLARDDLVAIVAERSERMAAAILAIWKCGAAYVPIDPGYPEDRIQSIIELSHAKLVLTDSSLSPPESGEDASNLNRLVDPGSLAYVIFTSGSTGEPKGAMVEHVGMLNHLLAKIEELKLGPESIVAQNASHCFDISVWQFFAGLLAGGRTVIVSQEAVMEPARFLEVIEATRINILEVVPSYVAVLLDRGAAALGSLKALLVTGEAVHVALIEQWFREFPAVPVINAYGPTEASDDVTHHQMEAPVVGAAVPVGKPIRNTRIYIVDAQMNLCPIGIKGEICVSGVGVGRGYLRDAERTKAVFLEDPFRAERGVRMYRTGDIGCFQADGTILFSGRQDHQVKIHGHRVELGEIENALARIAPVREATVVAHRADSGNAVLCAYVAFREGQSLREQELAAALSAVLPDYMVPGIYVVMDRLPLTRNGKTDRGALPPPDLSPKSSEKRYAAARTPTEVTLSAIWSATLGIEAPGIQDNFFSLGGDSIVGMQVVGRAARAGLRITTRQLFEYPTIAELAQVAVAISLRSSDSAPSTGPLPLAPMQRRFLERQKEERDQYNQALLLEVPTDTDPLALQQALRHAVGMHDALRLRFRSDGSAWRQEIAPVTEVPLEVQRILPAELDARISAAHAQLNISDGPITRAVLFRLHPDDSVRLLIVAHHLAIDAVSWGVLLETVFTAYRSLCAGEELRPQQDQTTWGAWMIRLGEWVRSGGASRNLPYWRALADARNAPLPLDYPAGPNGNTVASAEEIVIELSESLTQALLKEASRAYNTRINDLLLAALALTVREWTGDTRVLIDLEGHGREDIVEGLDISRTVGWFTSLYPVVLEVQPGLASTIRSVKEALRAVPANGLTFGLLRYMSEHARLLDSVPQPQLLFNYLGQSEQLLSGAGEWKIAPEPAGSGRGPTQTRDHLLTINGYVAGHRLHLAWEFSRHLHHRRTIERLAERYTSNLQSIIEHCLDRRSIGFTPSDFPAAGISQASLDELAAMMPDEIEDIFELTPTQQGMLFHSLQAPASNAYFTYCHCVIEGLDLPLFREAWQTTIGSNAVLRTSFHWKGLAAPVQVVRRHVSPSWHEEDISTLSENEAARRWQDHLEWARALGFDLAEAPLMRLSLFYLGANAWRFLWSHHHILLDGWSSVLVMDDVIRAYEALRLGRNPELPPARTFRDYVVWLRQQDHASAERFWRDKIGDFNAPTPLLEATPGRGGYAQKEILLSRGVSRSLVDFAQTVGLTMNTLAQGAWAALLGRYSGEAEVVYGTIVSGRPASLPHAEQIAGLFINSLPVRVRTEAPSLICWLRQLQADLARQEEYSYCPLAEIQNWSGVPAGTPLFETLLIFQNYPVTEAIEKRATGVEIKDFEVFDPNHYPLTVVVTPGERLSVRALYDSARFNEHTIARLLAHYETLLSSFPASAEKPLASLPLLTPPERQQIIAEWNDTKAPVPEGKTLVDLIDDQASLHPERVAVRCGSAVLTYRELSIRSTRLAGHFLNTANIQAEDRIAVLMPRSERMVETILAIWKCGAAYVPIDPSYPAARIQAILAGSRPALVVAGSGDLAETIRDITVVNLDSLPESQQFIPLPPRCTPSGLAYVIFTSGSTGKPKGVMVEHRGMLNHVLSMVRDLSLDSTSEVAQTASHCFDISVWQFFAPLAAGGEVVIYPDNIVREPARLIQSLNRDSVGVVQLVPSYLASFVAELESCGPNALPNTQWMVTIGETLEPSLVRSWFRLNPNTRLINAYGPTEASDSVAHYVMERPPEVPAIPIGKPIQNMRLYVMDAGGNLCPIGVKGEICIAGMGVGRGYLFDEERTLMSFTADPFHPGDRLYHTGDIGCYAPDGNLLFFGRRDFQVKIRGHRIELGEIESALMGLEKIVNAAVVAREERDGGKYLCAYVADGQGSRWTPSAIRSALAETLPAYMLPDVVRILPQLPVTPNGKINRAALPLADQPSAPVVMYAAPTTEAEAALVRIWREVLGREHIGIDDNFFDLGGHSLKAIQILSRIRRDLKADAGITDIFSFPTIRALARHLPELTPASQNPIVPVPPQEWHAVSHAQKRIWLASRAADSPAYNMSGALELKGHLDSRRLSHAFESLAERHESLRTVFAFVEGELKQHVQPVNHSGFQLEQVQADAAYAEELARRHATKPFDLAAGPLFRATLVHVGVETHFLLLSMHHIISDAWSIRVLLSDLLALYCGDPLPPLAVQYRDYAAWHNRLLQAPAMHEHRDYWLAKLGGTLPRLELSLDFARPRGPAHAGASIALEPGPPLLKALAAVASSRSTSLFAVVLSSICVLLHRYTGAEDVVIGSQTAGRDRPELDNQIGVFLNTIVLRVPVKGADTIGEVIGTVAAVVAEALDHSGYPFDRLLEELRVRTPLNRSPLFDIQVDYVPGPPAEARPDLELREISAENDTFKYDLTFHILEEAEALRILLIWKTALFHRTTIETMGERLLSILTAFADHSDMTVDEIPLAEEKSIVPAKPRAGLRLKVRAAASPGVEA